MDVAQKQLLCYGQHLDSLGWWEWGWGGGGLAACGRFTAEISAKCLLLFWIRTIAII